MIIHRLDEAEKLCDRVAIMVDGEIRQIGDPLTLKEKFGLICMLYITPKV